MPMIPPYLFRDDPHFTITMHGYAYAPAIAVAAATVAVVAAAAHMSRLTFPVSVAMPCQKTVIAFMGPHS